MNNKLASSEKYFLLKNNLFNGNRVNILDKRSKIMLVLLIYHYMSNFLFPSFRFYYHKINWCRNRWSMWSMWSRLSMWSSWSGLPGWSGRSRWSRWSGETRWSKWSRWSTDMEFVKKFTQPVFQAKNFTPQERVNCDIFLANQQRKCIKY